MSEQVDVETFCPKMQQQVTITLQLPFMQSPRLSTVTGQPVNCNRVDKCMENPKCLLKAERLTTGRKR